MYGHTLYSAPKKSRILAHTQSFIVKALNVPQSSNFMSFCDRENHPKHILKNNVLCPV